MGRATGGLGIAESRNQFQSAPSRGEGDHRPGELPGRSRFQSAPSRGEGDRHGGSGWRPQTVSIRALPWGGRPFRRSRRVVPWPFQSAPSRGEGDTVFTRSGVTTLSFNPRPPVGRATRWSISSRSTTSFNPRPPVGRATCCGCPADAHRRCFNPRPPVGRATRRIAAAERAGVVSIRALPWGGRRAKSISIDSDRMFQSAPSRGEGDGALGGAAGGVTVSIRALPWGGRRAWSSPTMAVAGFNPRPPVGRATGRPLVAPQSLLFQSAPSRGEGDVDDAPHDTATYVSIRALPWGGRLKSVMPIWLAASFNPRPPVGRATADVASLAAATCCVHLSASVGDTRAGAAFASMENVVCTWQRGICANRGPAGCSLRAPGPRLGQQGPVDVQ